MGFYRNNNGVIENLTPTAPPAIGIQYDNTSSGLEADNVQDAVDEVVEALDGKQDALTNPLTQSDVVNNLTSTATNVPLSAAMGKSLNDLKANIATTPIPDITIGSGWDVYSHVTAEKFGNLVIVDVYAGNISGSPKSEIGSGLPAPRIGNNFVFAYYLAGGAGISEVWGYILTNGTIHFRKAIESGDTAFGTFYYMV